MPPHEPHVALGATRAFGQGESLTDRLSFTRLFNSANCALAGGDCTTPASPSGTPSTPSPPGRVPMPPRGKTDVGVFAFTVSGKQTTTWNLDETGSGGPNCSIHVTGSGDQTITLKGVEPGWATPSPAARPRRRSTGPSY